MTIIDKNLLDKLTAEAAASPRLRKNLNFHSDLADPCNRLLNAVEPGSYIRPHRHLEPPKAESFLRVRGSLALVTFADGGSIERILLLSESSGVAGADLPPGVWHSLVSLEPGSVFFEAKPGPYRPHAPGDLAPWAPEEGGAEAVRYLAELEQAINAVSKR